MSERVLRVDFRGRAEAGERLLAECLRERLGGSRPDVHVACDGQLECGDVQYWEGERLVFVIERKAHADLANSLKTKHFEDEVLRIRRLSHDHPDCITALLFEGRRSPKWANHDFKVSGILARGLDSTLLKAQVVHGFRLMEALTVDHSARLIETLVNKLDPASGPKWTPTDSHAFAKNNVSLTAVHTKKRDNRAGTSTWARMLLQVEGVSQHKATRVLEAFASPRDLCTAAAADPDGTRKRLQDLDVTQYGAAKRARLGPKVAERIMSCVECGK